MQNGRVKDEGDDQPLSIEGVKDQLVTGAKILARSAVNEAARRNPGLVAFGLSLGWTVALVRRMRAEGRDLKQEARAALFIVGAAAGGAARREQAEKSARKSAKKEGRQ